MLVRRLSTVAALVLVLAAGASGVARADEPTAAALAQAREQFRRGIALEAAGDWEGALRVFKGVALVKSTPQVRFHIAQAEERTGDIVAALGSYRLASYEATEGKIKDVKIASDAAIKNLEPKIPKLTLQRGAGAAVAKVTLDGRELGPATVGAPISVNPGPHHVEASAPGRETITADFNLGAGEVKELSLVLPQAKAAPVAAITPVTDEPRSEAPEPPPKTSKVKIAGFIFGGAGIAALGVSGVFFGIRQSSISKLQKDCGPDGQSCPASDLSTKNNGQMAATVSEATFIGGAAALGLGLILVIAAPKKKAAPVAGLSLGPGNVSVAGTF
jgi:hypothetical protein